MFAQPEYTFNLIDPPVSPLISDVRFFAINDFNEVAANANDQNLNQYYVLRWKKTTGYSNAYSSPNGTYIFPNSINNLGTITANRYDFLVIEEL